MFEISTIEVKNIVSIIKIANYLMTLSKNLRFQFVFPYLMAEWK